MKTKLNATCRACRFFVSDGGFGVGAHGTCCRRAPTAITKEGESLNEYDLWPIVRGGMWCGEFEVADGREVED